MEDVAGIISLAVALFVGTYMTVSSFHEDGIVGTIINFVFSTLSFGVVAGAITYAVLLLVFGFGDGILEILGVL